ncbi:peptidoglycan-binding protein [Streptomyces sp. NPDC047000]|uniref:peptidoglycan-binding protein n=1 Tax=Streptomyces sp. NPDC047000 TaxID=3155474 RepID=UPI0033FAEA63
MDTPAFEEFDPASDCDCPGCVHWRATLTPTTPASTGFRTAGFRTVVAPPAVHRILIPAAVAAATAALGAGPAAPALAAPYVPPAPGTPVGPDTPVSPDEPATPQSGRTPLHGAGGVPALPAATATVPETTRDDIMKRAETWITAQVPYSMTDYWTDGYRQDCSGFVSMAWNLPGNEWTGSLGAYGDLITKDELQPGDMLLFHNVADPEKGSHVVLFDGWTDSTRTYYLAYEQTPPHARTKETPYPYTSHADDYVPYRYKGVKAGTAGSQASGTDQGTGGEATAYPGAAAFGPGADNDYVTRLGRMLIARGGASFYANGPGPRWGDADLRATRAFQQAQGWTGTAADGLPGPHTWDLLVTGKGKDIVTGASGASGVSGVTGVSGMRGGRRHA